MKRIFTLLFCAVAIGISANASDLPLVDMCINVLLGNEQPTSLMAPNLDANHDGAITIDDVTTLIDQALAAEQVNRAPAQEIDIDALVKEVLETQTGEPTIHDVNQAIDQNLKIKK